MYGTAATPGVEPARMRQWQPTQWTALALARSVEPGTTTDVLVDGRELVVWRDDAGRAHVWEDRCPHRGMRLSFGWFRGDRLACLYHGWQFDGGGQCRAIPAHPQLDPPRTIRTTPYPMLEALGLIWVSLDASTPEPLPLTARAVTPVRSVYLDCALDTAAEALAAADEPEVPGWSATPSRLEAVADHGALWTLGNGVDALLIAGMPIDAGRSALHILALGASTSDAGIAIARWAERLRGAAERHAARTRSVA